MFIYLLNQLLDETLKKQVCGVKSEFLEQLFTDKGFLVSVQKAVGPCFACFEGSGN